MIEPEKSSKDMGSPPDTGLLPPTFDTAYVEGAAKPFIVSGLYVGEQPTLPMIDLAFSKEKALPAHFWGMLYENYQPNMEEDGLSVFLQSYENRGADNERKRIYVSATTPDLYQPCYSAKVHRFLDDLFTPENEGKPLMRHYVDSYFDLYWDLHVGVRGSDIPAEVREIGQSFNAVLGYWYPTTDVVYQNYQRVRVLREPLRQWVDARVQDVLDRRIPDAEKTFVHYWVTNGHLGDNFRRKDIVFECFHDFLAFSQWGNTIYNVIVRLDQTKGDAAVKAWFERTMADPDRTDDTAFSALDRFVMELFRTISPNGGSLSTLQAAQQFLGAGYSTVLTPHPDTSNDPRFWDDPMAFDPDRYKTTPTSDQNNEDKCKQIGLARCPFGHKSVPVEDGRNVEITNSAFGAVYSTLDGKPQPIADYAGYAPFGFGYRRCAGESLTIDLFKDFFRKVWADHIVFSTLELPEAEALPVGPGTVIQDAIGFRRSQ